MTAPEIKELAFALQPDQIGGPVQSPYGYHIIQILARDPDRPFDEAQLSQRRSRALDEWLSKARKGSRVERLLTPDREALG